MEIINKEKKSKFWDSEIILTEIKKSEKVFIRISSCEKSGKHYINMTEFVHIKDKETKEDVIVPSKGKNLNIEKKLIPEFIELFEYLKENPI